MGIFGDDKEERMRNSYTTSIENDSIFISDTFEELYNNHPDGVFTLDLHGNVVHYNKSVEKIYGYNDREMIGEFSKHMQKESQVERNHYLQLALSGKAQNFKTIIFHKNGQPLDIDVTYIPILNQEKQVTGVYGIAKDMTHYIRSQNEVAKIKNSLELAQQVAKIGSWDYDIIENESYWSNQTFELYGIKNKEFVPTLQRVLQLVHPDDREHFQSTFQDAIRNRRSYHMEFRILRNDGSVIYVFEQADVILDESKNPIRFIGTIQDITRRKLAEKKLVESEQRFKNIYNNLEVGIWSFNIVTNSMILISPGVEDVTGYTPQYFSERGQYESIIHPEDFPHYQKLQTHLNNGETITHQYRIILRSGEVRWIQDQTIPVFDENGKMIRLDGIISNITEQKQYQEKIQHLAYHDYLTDLPNRRMLEEQIEALIDSSKKVKNPFSILYLDIDRMKKIMHTLGARIVDQLVIQFTHRISSLLNDSSLFARLDGDEFGILLWNNVEKDRSIQVAKQIIDGLKPPFIIEGFELYITTSIGISNFPSDGKTVDELLKAADVALYRAKEIGKNNYHIYSTSLNISTFKMYALDRDLHKAIQKEEFRVYFQPRVETATGEILSAEALIRWEHPEWGLVSPKEFIPLAEGNGLILEIGDWVLHQVCHFIREWKEKGIPLVPISINVSALRFLKSDWVSTIQSTLKEFDVNPNLIELEITESTLLHYEEEVTSTMQFLKNIGIKVAIDDFGMGYSSLAYIRQFPIDTIKLDRIFISNISNTKMDEMIIKSMIYLAKGMNLSVVAEGVETMEQLAFLHHHGCTEIQGYLFSRPVSEQEFQQLLRKILLEPVPQTKEKKIVEDGELNRIDFIYPLSSKMSLIEMKGKRVKLENTEILIESIGPNGLKFLSSMYLPARQDITLQCVTKIMGNEVILTGHIVWKEEVDELFQYDLQFSIEKNEKDKLIQLMNSFSIKLRETPLVPDCSFVLEDKIQYIKKLSGY